jgi:phage portal protein, HK97 family
MFKWFRRKSDSFNSVLSQLLAWTDSAGWTRKDYAGYAREAYEKNIVAYYCITQVARGVSDIPFIVTMDGKETDKGKIVQLLNRPNPAQSYKTFMRTAVTHKLVSGNTYILGFQATTKRMMDLSLLRPDRVTIEVDSNNEPIGFRYNMNGRQVTFPIERGTLLSEVLHIKEPNLLDDLYGMSPISAAMMSIDQHNSSGMWNRKLLENSAKPPGILTMRDRGDLAPSPKQEQLDEIRDRLEEKYAGAKNAGKIPVFGFDLQWQSLGMTPTDMDWINGKNSTARDICLAFGYPPHLLGMSDGATFNNVSEAKLALYEETIIPIAQNMLAELGYYLSVHQGIQVEIVPDLDKVSALMPRRETARRNARDDVQAGIITPNEARQEIGYEEVEGGDDILVPAGKLPLNFDMTDLDEKQFTLWLMREGYSQKEARETAKQAYSP